MSQEYEYARIQYGTAELIEGESNLPPGVIYMLCGEGDNSSSNTTVTSSIPAGIITMWSGSITSIPNGWVLCDGENGTPDLRDRFILGAGNAYTVGATGGSTKGEILASDLPVPTHTHEMSFNWRSVYMGDGSMIMKPLAADNSGGATNSTTKQTSSTSTNSNKDKVSFDIMPPYYALAYIMKL